MTILVTGGAGFIGGNFVRHLQETVEEHVVVIDKLGYASNLNYIPDTPQFHFENCDLLMKIKLDIFLQDLNHEQYFTLLQKVM